MWVFFSALFYPVCLAGGKFLQLGFGDMEVPHYRVKQCIYDDAYGTDS